MIIYFSGTGNSKFIADGLAEMLNETCESIPQLIDEKQYIDIKDGENLVIVYPTYAWQPPAIVLNYLKKIKISANAVVTAITTVGGEAGNGMSVLGKALDSRGFKLTNTASVKMPDNFIAMFEMPTEQEIKDCIVTAKSFIEKIGGLLLSKKQFTLADEGKMATLKTSLVYPLFKTLMISPKKFKNNDKCINCGKCIDICPTHNISIIANQVTWGKDCQWCMACIQRCPFEAIEYGNKTQKKPRYFLEKYL